MRVFKLVIPLIFIICLLPLTVNSQECDFAIPNYGIVECRATEESEKILVNFTREYDEWSKKEVECPSECKIRSYKYIDIICPGSYTPEYEIFKSDEKISISFPIRWYDGDILEIRARCISGNDTYDLREDSHFKYIRKEIKLFEGWDNETLSKPLEGTKECSFETFKRAELDFYKDPMTQKIEFRPIGTYENLEDYPTEWDIGDHYYFIKGWETEIPGFFTVKGNNNETYWAEERNDSRKIYDVENVIDPNGKCYAVPKGILASDVECLYDYECNSTEDRYICNSNTWKCEKVKWCNSDEECTVLFGNTTCYNNKVTEWKCNFYEPWGKYRGTCEEVTYNVEECPDECNSSEEYNFEGGRCESKENYVPAIQGYVVSNMPKETKDIQWSFAKRGSVLLLISIILVEIVFYFREK